MGNWKNQKDKKPKAVFIATSGGGSRAMLWSMIALQHLNPHHIGKTLQSHIIKHWFFRRYDWFSVLSRVSTTR